MGIISRFAEIMKANINDLLDRCEDPVKMLDQTLRNLNENFADVKKETAGVMAEEARAKRNLDIATEDVDKWDGYVRKALKAGNEGDAREFLVKKNSAVQKQADAQKVYDIAKDNADKMKAIHDKLYNDIQVLESKREQIKAKVAVAKTQESINRIASGTDSTGTILKFDSIESRVNKRLDTVIAEAELNSRPTDIATELTVKYDNEKAVIDAELEK